MSPLTVKDVMGHIISLEDDGRFRVTHPGSDERFKTTQEGLTGLPAADLPPRRTVTELMKKRKRRGPNHGLLQSDVRPVYILGSVTIGELARGVGLHHASMSNIIHGKRLPTVPVLRRMAAYLSAANGATVSMEDVLMLLEVRPWERRP